jgi:hypothetical protein
MAVEPPTGFHLTRDGIFLSYIVHLTKELRLFGGRGKNHPTDRLNFRSTRIVLPFCTAVCLQHYAPFHMKNAFFRVLTAIRRTLRHPGNEQSQPGTSFFCLVNKAIGSSLTGGPTYHLTKLQNVPINE